jgi:hypothetical protein
MIKAWEVIGITSFSQPFTWIVHTSNYPSVFYKKMGSLKQEMELLDAWMMHLAKIFRFMSY